MEFYRGQSEERKEAWHYSELRLEVDDVTVLRCCVKGLESSEYQRSACPFKNLNFPSFPWESVWQKLRERRLGSRDE